MDSQKLRELFRKAFAKDRLLYNGEYSIAILKHRESDENENYSIRERPKTLFFTFEEGSRSEPLYGDDFGDLILQSKFRNNTGVARFNFGGVWPKEYYSDDVTIQKLVLVAKQKIKLFADALIKTNLAALHYFLNTNTSGRLIYFFNEFPSVFEQEFHERPGIIEESVMACIKDNENGEKNMKDLLELAKTAASLSEESATLKKYLGIARQLNSRGDDVLQRIFDKHHKVTHECYQDIAQKYLSQGE